MELAHILNHLGEDRENYYNAVSGPIFQNSIFCFKDVAAMRDGIKKELEAPFYTRGYNPTVGTLRKKLAALEGAEDALVFASGSAAIAAGIMSVVKNGDHVVCVNKPYTWTKVLLSEYLPKYGVTTTFVDGTQLANFEKAIQKNTKLIYLESPNSITFELQDIEAVAKLARSKGITTMIDNSYSSPLAQNPISMGIDIVAHSGSKYLGGHSDIVAGVLCSSHKRIHEIMSKEFMTLGAIISPNDAWLMIRGIRTLELRVKRSAESAEKVISFLEQHPKVEKVLHPFSKQNPQLDLAKKQMKHGSGLLSILIKAEKPSQIESFSNALKYFLLTCSWGGYESLVFPMVGIPSTAENPNPNPWNLVRLYIGLEDPEVIIQDLKQALEKV